MTEVFRHESQVALEKVRLASQELEKETHLREVANYSNPPSVMVRVACSFAKLIFLGSDFDWAEFQQVAMQFEEMKEAMLKFGPNLCLTDNILQTMLPIWHHYAEYQEKLRGISPSAVLLLDFVHYSVEYKIKKTKFNEAKHNLPEVGSNNPVKREAHQHEGGDQRSESLHRRAELIPR